MLVTGCVDLDGNAVSVRIRDGEICERSDKLAPVPGETLVDGRGGTVLPGLHDHHVHLRSIAASLDSLELGPPAVHTAAHAVAAIRTAPVGTDGWIRAVKYHESVAGVLDRHVLDSWMPAIPVRVQHRSGALWIVNSAGLGILGIDDHPDGRLFRSDETMSALAGDRSSRLTEVSATLSAFGVTGCTDATPDLTPDSIDWFENEIRTGRFRQRLHLLARQDRPDESVTFGPVKRILDDTDLDLEAMEQWIRAVHDVGQSVAVHCVTVAQLVLTTVALRATGSRAGDRIEHAAIVPDDMLDELVDLGVTVVTQPNFVSERGDRYLDDVPVSERNQLWRLASLIRSGVPVAASTDAPFGNLDPWACMRAARSRSTPFGPILGEHERVESRTAIALFLGEAHAPAVPRVLEPGHPADLCILGAAPRTVLGELTAELVRTTIVRGVVVHDV